LDPGGGGATVCGCIPYADADTLFADAELI